MRQVPRVLSSALRARAPQARAAGTPTAPRGMRRQVGRGIPGRLHRAKRGPCSSRPCARARQACPATA
eukprot:13572976-Alexandrium_andersonii.AAC.1